MSHARANRKGVSSASPTPFPSRAARAGRMAVSWATTNAMGHTSIPRHRPMPRGPNPRRLPPARALSPVRLPRRQEDQLQPRRGSVLNSALSWGAGDRLVGRPHARGGAAVCDRSRSSSRSILTGRGVPAGRQGGRGWGGRYLRGRSQGPAVRFGFSISRRSDLIPWMSIRRSWRPSSRKRASRSDSDGEVPRRCAEGPRRSYPWTLG
jgi:hypothetical protein